MNRFTKMESSKRKILANEWKWFRRHGASRAAYRKHSRYGSGPDAIYEADFNALQRAIRNCRSAKRGSPPFDPRPRSQRRPRPKVSLSFIVSQAWKAMRDENESIEFGYAMGMPGECVGLIRRSTVTFLFRLIARAGWTAEAIYREMRARGVPDKWVYFHSIELPDAEVLADARRRVIR